MGCRQDVILVENATSPIDTIVGQLDEDQPWSVRKRDVAVDYPVG